MFGLPQDKLDGYDRPNSYQIYMDVVINFSIWKNNFAHSAGW
jgi:hypothetical protein